MKILVCANNSFVIEEIGNGVIEVDFNNRLEPVGPDEWFVIDKSHLAYNELDRGVGYDLIITLNIPYTVVDNHQVELWRKREAVDSKSLFTYLQELEEEREFLELGDDSIAISFKDDKYYWCIVEEPDDGFESWYSITKDVYDTLSKEVSRRNLSNNLEITGVNVGFKKDDLQCIVAGSNINGKSNLTPEDCLARGLHPYNPNIDFEGDVIGPFELPITPKECDE